MGEKNGHQGVDCELSTLLPSAWCHASVSLHFHTNPSSFIILIVTIIIIVICFIKQLFTERNPSELFAILSRSLSLGYTSWLLLVHDFTLFQKWTSSFILGLNQSSGVHRTRRVVFPNEPQSVRACIFAPEIASCDPSCKSRSAMLQYSSLKYACQFNSQRNHRRP